MIDAGRAATPATLVLAVAAVLTVPTLAAVMGAPAASRDPLSNAMVPAAPRCRARCSNAYLLCRGASQPDEERCAGGVFLRSPPGAARWLAGRGLSGPRSDPQDSVLRPLAVATTLLTCRHLRHSGT